MRIIRRRAVQEEDYPRLRGNPRIRKNGRQSVGCLLVAGNRKETSTTCL
jgi:hypothetical protein